MTERIDIVLVGSGGYLDRFECPAGMEPAEAVCAAIVENSWVLDPGDVICIEAVEEGEPR